MNEEAFGGVVGSSCSMLDKRQKCLIVLYESRFFSKWLPPEKE